MPGVSVTRRLPDAGARLSALVLDADTEVVVSRLGVIRSDDVAVLGADGMTRAFVSLRRRWALPVAAALDALCAMG